MVETKGQHQLRLWSKVVPVVAMMLMLFRQKSRIRSFWKFTLLINESQNVHRLHSDKVQGLLVVNELNVLPIYRFIVVFFLLKTHLIYYVKAYWAFSVMGPTMWNNLPLELHLLPRTNSSAFYS